MPINLASLRTGKTIYDLFDSEKIAKTYIDSLSYPDLRHKIGIELEFLSPLYSMIMNLGLFTEAFPTA